MMECLTILPLFRCPAISGVVSSSRILIAEDNADMREYLTNVLLEDDHKIFAIEDGLKIIKFLEMGGVRVTVQWRSRISNRFLENLAVFEDFIK